MIKPFNKEATILSLEPVGFSNLPTPKYIVIGKAIIPAQVINVPNGIVELPGEGTVRIEDPVINKKLVIKRINNEIIKRTLLLLIGYN